MKHKPKNDNLLKHKELLQKRNKALVERAIAHINQLGGDISMSIVSRVTYEIARSEDKEKGITLAGISKNPIYRHLVEQAKAESERKQGTHRKNHLGHYSDGDIRMMLHALRVENSELKSTNKILTQQLREETHVIETSEPIEDTLIKEYNTIRNIARSMTNRLCELELAYIDANTGTLKVMHYDEILVPHDALKQFYLKELDDIQRKIREHASNG
ncbi:hypothetical protein MNB_SV-3-145 [hydrothermal vent metagenome]|uniref:Uncharacterized protein n=1 Tax=hydrothermal vent metagenome TaxID=652676 RepID=A0A1W1BQN9_9ZZZZ